MLLKPELSGKKSYKELYEKYEEEEDRVDDAWKADFFGALKLEEIVEIANAANYLDMPVVIDSCCEVIALHLREATDNATRADPKHTKVSIEEDASFRTNFNWVYNQSYLDLAKQAIQRLF